MCLALQMAAHKKGREKEPLQGVQGLALLQVGEVLYTANTAGHAEAILSRLDLLYFQAISSRFCSAIHLASVGKFGNDIAEVGLILHCTCS